MRVTDMKESIKMAKNMEKVPWNMLAETNIRVYG
jgi:hypothetical protein